MSRYNSSTALIVVDMQNDFADPQGSLFVKQGDQIAVPIAAQMRKASEAGALVIATQDWHPESTPHFAKDGGLWPVHCVQDSWGSWLVRPVERTLVDIAGLTLRKGDGPWDSYSAFSYQDLESGQGFPTGLDQLLFHRDVSSVVIVGLAGDWCVKATALDAAGLGYFTEVLLDLTRFVELKPGDTNAAIDALRDAEVVLGVSA